MITIQRKDERINELERMLAEAEGRIVRMGVGGAMVTVHATSSHTQKSGDVHGEASNEAPIQPEELQLDREDQDSCSDSGCKPMIGNDSMSNKILKDVYD